MYTHIYIYVISLYTHISIYIISYIYSTKTKTSHPKIPFSNFPSPGAFILGISYSVAWSFTT